MYLKLLMARYVKKSPKQDRLVSRSGEMVTSKYNLSFDYIFFHSPVCLCISGPDPAKLHSKEHFLFDVNRRRNIFNLPVTVLYPVHTI